MFRRTFAIMLSGILLVTAFGFQHVIAQTVNENPPGEKIRAKVQKIGVGPNARVEVKLHDNTQLKGYVSSMEKDSFTVLDNQTGSTTAVSYADASAVKKLGGGGPSAKTWIILGAAAVGAIVTWIIVKPALCDGGAQTRGPC